MRISTLWLISAATVALADGISLGCYDTTATDMVSASQDNLMSSKACNDECRSQGKAVFMINEKSCWCGGSIPAPGAKASPEMCNNPCPGYPAENCGGKSGNTLFFNFYQATNQDGSPVVNSYSTQKAQSTATTPSSASSSAAATSSSSSSSSTEQPSSSSSDDTSSNTPSSTSSTQPPSTTTTSTSSSDSSSSTDSTTGSTSSDSTSHTTGSPTTTSPTRTSGTSMTSASSDAQSSASATAGALTEEEKDKKSGGISGGAIAGIVIGVVAGIALVGLAFFILRRRRQSYEYQTQASDRYGFTDDPFTTAAEDKMNFSHNGTSAFVPVDQRLNPALINQRRMSEGSIADEQDYSRKILRVANPDA
ncbi:hypothetical protein B0I75DRAFT_139261 [Yarrowia lipolytica]|nr:hypothetical protein B0I74DRAFT_139416 [Yarrowia lipolytica]RDW51826.1 hypothetical protein B0I75DRAFT_139261 [Yarrowia lipolytica]